MSPLEGSTIIYKKIILPYFLKHESAIDDVVKKGSEKIAKLADSAIEKGTASGFAICPREFLGSSVLTIIFMLFFSILFPAKDIAAEQQLKKDD